MLTPSTYEKLAEIVRIMFPANKINGMALAVRLLLAVLVAFAASGCNRSRDDAQARQLATRVRTESLHAWNNYERHAWGHDALRPLSKTPHDWYGQSLLNGVVYFGSADGFLYAVE
jgi:hypothetical protein